MKNLIAGLMFVAVIATGCLELDAGNSSGGGGAMMCVTDNPCDTGLQGVCGAGRLSCDTNASCLQTNAPSIERCDTPEDENCDGKGCSGNHLWNKHVGSTNSQQGFSISIDGQGNVVITGRFRDVIDFGAEPLVSAGDNDMFVAKLDPSGKLLWNRRFGDAQAQSIQDGTVDAEGNILIAGHTNGSMSFGNDVIMATPTGGGDVFVAKLDPNGTPLWARYATGDLYQGYYAIAADLQGNVIVVGETQGTIDWNGQSLPSSGMGDVLIAKFDKDGKDLWVKQLGGVEYDGAWGVKTDSKGDIYFTGQFCGPADLGGGPLTPVGECEGFFTKFDALGNHVWSKILAGPMTQYGIDVTVDSQDDVVFTFQYIDTVNLGGDPLPSPPMIGDTGIVKFDSEGNHLWSKRLFNTGKWVDFIPAVDSLDNIIIIGASNGSVDFGGGTLQPQGIDGLVAKLDAKGNHVWSHHYAASGTINRPRCAAVAPLGEIWMVGEFDGTIDFGTGPMISDGLDTYIVRFEP